MSTASAPRHRELDGDGLVVVGLLAGILISLVIHFVGLPLLMGVLQLLDLLHPASFEPPPPPAEVEIVAFEEPEPEPEPEPPASEPPAPEPDVAEPEPEPPSPRVPPPANEALPPPPAPGPPPQADPAPEEPLDLTGLTLTSEGGSFAVAAGDGTEREGPIGPPPPRTVPRGRPDGVPGGTGGGSTEGTGPPVVAFRDLSRRPEQPSGLGERLEQLYPAEARSQGLDGQAIVRFRIEPDGSLSGLRVVSESVSGFGFGAACVQSLRGQRFTPPLDRNGNAVATIVTRFPCSWRVRN